jgi:hypothetical protein
MAEVQKKERVVKQVTLTDGRVVEFVGTSRVNKEIVIDESKVQLDGEMLVLQQGAIGVRMDFVTGDTRTYIQPLSLIPKFAGHGGSQKYGDCLASPASKPLADEDLVIACDDLDETIQKGEWSTRREGDGFSGASIVIKAFMEASGKDQASVKAFLNGMLEAAKLKGEKLSRKDLYDSFRNPATKVGKIIDRLEKERLSSTAKVDADAVLEAAMAA